MTPQTTLAERLRDTRDAFDSVAADYDGPRGNNASIQELRSEMWRWLDTTFVPGSRLLDLGCGTGLDAVRMAGGGHHVTATDWSPAMIVRTAERARENGLDGRVQALALGAHELRNLPGERHFDGAYSNLGPLNCVPDPAEMSAQLSRLLRPGGALAFSVIGRICPWEMAHYARRGRWARVKIRYARGTVAVGMNKHTIWTRYYTPRAFYRAFAAHFTLEHYRGLCLFAPPPYLDEWRERHADTYRRLWALDRRLAGWPLLRSMGDHFLIVMRKR
jgi:SAM-dependent methyltransferase